VIELALDLVQAAEDQRETVVGGHGTHRRERPRPEGDLPGQPLVGRADQTRPLHCAVVGEVCCFLCFSHIIFRPIPLSRFDPVLGFVRLRQKFVRWSQRQDKTAISAASLLADQQNKSSGSYQQGKQNTGDERNNPMPTGLDFFRSSAFLRRSETQPEEIESLPSIIKAPLGCCSPQSRSPQGRRGDKRALPDSTIGAPDPRDRQRSTPLTPA
jgi:hypothetical protein